MIYEGKSYTLKQGGGLSEACSSCAFFESKEACNANADSCGGRGYFVVDNSEQTTKFKSDGGSSDYYKLKIKRASDG